MDVKALVMAMVEMVGGHPNKAVQKHIAQAAPVVARETPPDVDPLLVAAVIVRESTINPWAKGARGEIGLMQIHPAGMALHLCRDLLGKLWNPAFNIRCGIRILRRARERCPGPPLDWLGAYNGRRCGPSPYAEKVLGLLARRQFAEAFW